VCRRAFEKQGKMQSRQKPRKAAWAWQRSGATNGTTRDHHNVVDDRHRTPHVGATGAGAVAAAAAAAVIAAVPYHHTIATTTDRDPTLVTTNADRGLREMAVGTTMTVEVDSMIGIGTGTIAAHHHSRSQEISLEVVHSGIPRTRRTVQTRLVVAINIHPIHLNPTASLRSTRHHSRLNLRCPVNSLVSFLVSIFRRLRCRRSRDPVDCQQVYLHRHRQTLAANSLRCRPT
jgi:hypothetical protein